MFHNSNPIKGNVINHPDGPNVYPGVVIDYKSKVRRVHCCVSLYMLVHSYIHVYILRFMISLEFSCPVCIGFFWHFFNSLWEMWIALLW